MKLNLGCGFDKKAEYVNCDIDIKTKPDMVMDFNETFPFKDNSFEGVLMCHSLEHCKDIGFMLSECFRVAKKAEIFVPAPLSPNYEKKEHRYLFEIHGLRGRHRKFPEFIQKFLGKFIPTEYVVKIRKNEIK